MNQELQEAINTMYTNASAYFNKMRPNPVGPVGPKPPNFPQGIVNQVAFVDFILGGLCVSQAYQMLI